MSHRNSLLLSLAGFALFLASCAQNPNDPKLVKTHPEYKNPHQPGTYEFFVAETSYPKTHDSWTNQELLTNTKASNSWLNINLETQRGKIMNGDQVVIDYPICSGRSTHPTPEGTYKILEKIVDKSSNKYGRIYDAEGKLHAQHSNSGFQSTLSLYLPAPSGIYYLKITVGNKIVYKKVVKS